VAGRLPLGRFSEGEKRAVVAFAAVLFLAIETFAIPKKAWHGMADVAEQLLLVPEFQKTVFLVSSDATVEGIFISEVAMRESRPSHIILRTSKVMGDSRWDGGDYKPRYSTPAEVMSYLERIPVGLVVIDLSIPVPYQREHHAIFKETLEAYEQQWELLGTYPLIREGKEYPDALRLYRLLGHENQPIGAILLDLRRMLNKTIAME
jgi:hypothetical protein